MTIFGCPLKIGEVELTSSFTAGFWKICAIANGAVLKRENWPAHRRSLVRARGCLVDAEAISLAARALGQHQLGRSALLGSESAPTKLPQPTAPSKPVETSFATLAESEKGGCSVPPILFRLAALTARHAAEDRHWLNKPASKDELLLFSRSSWRKICSGLVEL